MAHVQGLRGRTQKGSKTAERGRVWKWNKTRNITAALDNMEIPCLSPLPVLGCNRSGNYDLGPQIYKAMKQLMTMAFIWGIIGATATAVIILKL